MTARLFARAACACALAAAVLLGACGESSTEGPPINTEIRAVVLQPDSVSISPTDTVTLSLALENITRSAVLLVSRDTSVAAVNASGTVRGVKAGRTFIVARAADGARFDSTLVIVSNIAQECFPVTIAPASASMRIGETLLSSAFVCAAQRPVAFSSADTTVAVVDQTGRVVARGAGRTTITARAVSSTASLAVQVVADNGTYPGNVVLFGFLPNGGVCNQMQVTALTSPFVAPARFIWTSSRPDVAEVTNAGLITPLRAGETLFTIMWATDTTIRTTRTFNVVTTTPGAFGQPVLQVAGSQTAVRNDSVYGTVDAGLAVFVYNGLGTEMQLLIDSTIVGRLPYPQGCPQTTSRTFTNIATTAFTNGSHDLVTRLVDAAGAVKVSYNWPITIKNP